MLLRRSWFAKCRSMCFLNKLSMESGTRGWTFICLVVRNIQITGNELILYLVILGDTSKK